MRSSRRCVSRAHRTLSRRRISTLDDGQNRCTSRLYCSMDLSLQCVWFSSLFFFFFRVAGFFFQLLHRSRSRRSSTRSRLRRSTLPAPSLARYRSSQSSLGTSYPQINGCVKNRLSAPCAPPKVTPTLWCLSQPPSFRETQYEHENNDLI